MKGGCSRPVRGTVAITSAPSVGSDVGVTDPTAGRYAAVVATRGRRSQRGVCFRSPCLRIYTQRTSHAIAHVLISI